MEEEIEDALLDVLEDLEADTEEFINRRINHLNFARTIFWICVKTRKEDYVYASELAKFLKVSQARANQILNDFVRADLLRKRFPTSNLVEYWAIKKKEKILILDYFEKARKVLGIKSQLIIKPEEK